MFPPNSEGLLLYSKNDSSPLAIIPNERLHNGYLPPGFGNGTSSENNSLPHTRGTNKQLNGTLAPGFWIESGSRNDSFGNGTSSKNNSLPHTSGPDENQLNGTLALGFQKESGSRNDSSQSSRMPDDKLLDGLMASGFDERS
ncbi:hypothetical protein Peur_004096 [Populus x canadensis]